MKPWLALLLCLPLVAHAEIYRWRDAQGNIIYSDEPVPGAERVDTAAGAGPARSAPMVVRHGPQTPAQPGGPYRSFELLVPADKAVIVDPEGAVPVEVRLEPFLDIAAGHRFRITVDGGDQVHYTTIARYKLVGLGTGTHRLVVEVVDADDRVLAGPVEVDFFSRRP